ncbi:hypothetical protein MUCCIDRAFT_116288 [Mucor lusitanicus CBS 277.49]|uniref:Uncharacterized protein n=1 Tax=Mucor lusitanicus CBS 277.49 TaxID=747725 RepID=A0A168GF59_MUCCL|nr:hypothetical protein MUCCIDRAFT_116288 [Mucor lusitanicus CBS 277.49]
MDKILSYLPYNYLICFSAEEDCDIRITGSSNRTISIDTQDLFSKYEFDNKDDASLFNYSVFPKYFKLLSKTEVLSENEEALLASIRDLFKRAKENLSEAKGISFDTVQILFVMPLDWTEELYKSKLRGFFLDTDWIKPEDNESKLIMIPFIRVLVDDFQQYVSPHNEPLSRERTSVLFSVQPANEHGEQTANEDGLVKFSYTFFKMQSAPEMIAVSKTLASSDFWLVPSVMHSDSIQLENLRNVIYNAVRNILARIRGEESTRGLERNTTKEDDPAWIRRSVTLSSVGLKKGIDFEKHQLQDLKSWSIDQLIATILKEANVKQYFEQVCNFYKKATKTYKKATKTYIVVRDAPDGIQHILLYNSYHFRVSGDFSGQDFSDWIRDALIEKNIIQPGNEVLDVSHSSAEVAFQQPYKIMQIANAILPPVIVGDEEQNEPTVQVHEHKDSLITPNSFYVQANIAETQIDFILNKEVSSSEHAAGLFTVQERSIAVEDIVTAITHSLWNHYQSMLDIQEQQHCLFKRCQDHETMPLLSSNYVEFKRNAEKLIECWFATNDAFSGEKLDSYSLILVDQGCSCALKLSQRLLLEVGLKPAVGNLATTITSALFSNDFFGHYQLSTLIVDFYRCTTTDFYCYSRAGMWPTVYPGTSAEATICK